MVDDNPNGGKAIDNIAVFAEIIPIKNITRSFISHIIYII